MSVRLSLLAILALGPCYGYQLRLEYERRTAAHPPLNIGQVYATLERLARDGLVTKAETDAAGHVYYAITAAGRTEAATWLRSPVAPPAREDLATKLALALTLPGADPAALIAAQRALATETLASTELDATLGLADRLIAEARVLGAEAELRWLDRCESLLVGSEPYELQAEPPRRGRPVVAPTS